MRVECFCFFNNTLTSNDIPNVVTPGTLTSNDIPDVVTPGFKFATEQSSMSLLNL